MCATVAALITEESPRITLSPASSISPFDFAKLIEAVDPKPDEITLDAMAGYGAVAKGILEREPKADIYVLDESMVQLERAMQNVPGLQPTRFLLAKIQDSGIPDSCFDTVVMKMGLHEVSLGKQVRVVAEIKRILKPRGKFVIWDIMLSSETQALFQNIIRKKDELSGFDMLVQERYFFTEEEFMQTVKNGGFNVVAEFHPIRYRFSSKKRLQSELYGDTERLNSLNAYIRKIFPENLKAKMGYVDSGDDIQFDITKKIFIAQ